MVIVSLLSLDINECTEFDRSQLLNCDTEDRANCTNFYDGYVCTCLPGYTGNGTECIGELYEKHCFLHN